jgi:hypothetical protein
MEANDDGRQDGKGEREKLLALKVLMIEARNIKTTKD